jgi:hypothetical protein
MPIAIESGDAGHLGDQHDADLTEADGGDQALEPVTIHAAGAREPKIVVNDARPWSRPTQLHGGLGQLVLTPCTLLMLDQLLGGRLADIHHRRPRQMRRQNTRLLVHRRLLLAALRSSGGVDRLTRSTLPPDAAGSED